MYYSRVVLINQRGGGWLYNLNADVTYKKKKNNK